MKILYDHQRFSVQNVGGITRYFFELIKSFQLDKDLEVKLSAWFSNNLYLKDLEEKIPTFFENKSFKGKRFIMYNINQLKVINDLTHKDFDIFHPTYYDPFFLKYLGNKPFVITVYDMCHEIYLNKENQKSQDKTTQQKKLLLTKANKIIAISEHTKNDILKLYPDFNPDNIEVIHLGNSLNPLYLKKISLPDKFILFVGGRNGYKNFKQFVKETSILLQKDKTLYIICAGGGKFNKEEYELLKELNILDKVIQMSIDDETLAYIYKKASVFVFPSLYEGFGIPILESFSCECPVILSNRTCFPEIAQDSAEYFEPDISNSLHDSLNKVIYNSNYSKNLVKKGTLRLKDFSWKNTAYKTKKLYKTIL